MFRLGKLVQRFTDAFELPVIDYIFHRLGADRSDLEFAATLLGVAAARIVDDQPPHDTRSIAHESCAVGERRTALRGHVKVRLVEERCNTDAHRSDAMSREFAL